MHVKHSKEIDHKHTYLIHIKYCSCMNNYNPSYTANSQVIPDKFNLHKIC